MQQRMTLVTLGVGKLDRAIAFYSRLGGMPHQTSVQGEVAFFDLVGMVLAL